MSSFDQTYVASKKRAIRDLFVGTAGIPGIALDPSVRESKAYALAMHGEVIDPEIDCNGGDPWIIMSNRTNYGYITVPALLQKLPDVWLPPGVHVPGVPDYDPTLWKVKVSIDPADYPPYVDPDIATKYVGAYAGGGLYNVVNNPETVFTPGEKHTEEPYQDKGIEFTFLPAPAIGQYFWQVITPS